jgi:hypothetical protein
MGQYYESNSTETTKSETIPETAWHASSNDLGPFPGGYHNLVCRDKRVREKVSYCYLISNG